MSEFLPRRFDREVKLPVAPMPGRRSSSVVGGAGETGQHIAHRQYRGGALGGVGDDRLQLPWCAAIGRRRLADIVGIKDHPTAGLAAAVDQLPQRLLVVV